jgi:hypothetical protein
MDTERTIADLCRRYGVPLEFGERMKPLLERAREKKPRVRLRLFRMVKESFEEEARRIRATRSPRDMHPEDWNVIKAVAAVLHEWRPPVWLRVWEQTQRRAGD